MTHSIEWYVQPNIHRRNGIRPFVLRPDDPAPISPSIPSEIAPMIPQAFPGGISAVIDPRSPPGIPGRFLVVFQKESQEGKIFVKSSWNCFTTGWMDFYWRFCWNSSRYFSRCSYQCYDFSKVSNINSAYDLSRVFPRIFFRNLCQNVW